MTGELFSEQTPEVLAAVLAQFDPTRYDALLPARSRGSAPTLPAQLGDYLEQVLQGENPAQDSE